MALPAVEPDVDVTHEATTVLAEKLLDATCEEFNSQTEEQSACASASENAAFVRPTATIVPPRRLPVVGSTEVMFGATNGRDTKMGFANENNLFCDATCASIRHWPKLASGLVAKTFRRSGTLKLPEMVNKPKDEAQLTSFKLRDTVIEFDSPKTRATDVTFELHVLKLRTSKGMLISPPESGVATDVTNSDIETDGNVLRLKGSESKPVAPAANTNK